MEEAVRKLRELRDNPDADTDLVLRLARTIGVEQGPTVTSLLNIGDEIWLIYEQCYIAALVAGEDDLAKQLLLRMRDKFGATTHIECLQGLYLEAMDHTDEALKYYNEILEHDKSKAPIWKRKITLLRSVGLKKDAVQQLVLFLDIFYADSRAWLELAELYREQNLYELALFCHYETLLINPYSHFLNVLAAECAFILASSSPDKRAYYIEALGYYLRSIELCEGYIRGFLGIYHTVRAIQNTGSGNSKDDSPKNKSYSREALSRLLTLSITRLSEARKRGDISSSIASAIEECQ